LLLKSAAMVILSRRYHKRRASLKLAMEREGLSVGRDSAESVSR